jgi:hypothetical protein
MGTVIPTKVELFRAGAFLLLLAYIPARPPPSGSISYLSIMEFREHRLPDVASGRPERVLSLPGRL